MSLGKISHLKVQTSTVKKFHLGIKIKDKLEDEVKLLNRVDFFLGVYKKARNGHQKLQLTDIYGSGSGSI